MNFNGYRMQNLAWLAISALLPLSACTTPASAACIEYATNRPMTSEDDTVETQLSVQNLDVAMENACN